MVVCLGNPVTKLCFVPHGQECSNDFVPDCNCLVLPYAHDVSGKSCEFVGQWLDYFSLGVGNLKFLKSRRWEICYIILFYFIIISFYRRVRHIIKELSKSK